MFGFDNLNVGAWAEWQGAHLTEGLNAAAEFGKTTQKAAGALMSGNMEGVKQAGGEYADQWQRNALPYLNGEKQNGLEALTGQEFHPLEGVQGEGSVAAPSPLPSYPQGFQPRPEAELTFWQWLRSLFPGA